MGIIVQGSKAYPGQNRYLGIDPFREELYLQLDHQNRKLLLHIQDRFTETEVTLMSFLSVQKLRTRKLELNVPSCTGTEIRLQRLA